MKKKILSKLKTFKHILAFHNSKHDHYTYLNAIKIIYDNLLIKVFIKLS